MAGVHCFVFTSVIQQAWLGHRKGVHPIKTYTCSEIIFQNSQRKRIQGEPANQGLPGKWIGFDSFPV